MCLGVEITRDFTPDQSQSHMLLWMILLTTLMWSLVMMGWYWCQCRVVGFVVPVID